MKSSASATQTMPAEQCACESFNELASCGTSPSVNVLGVRVDALSMDGALAKIARILRCRG